jgi:hypothetical protein
LSLGKKSRAGLRPARDHVLSGIKRRDCSRAASNFRDANNASGAGPPQCLETRNHSPVEQSSLPVHRTLGQLEIPRATFYRPLRCNAATRGAAAFGVIDGLYSLLLAFVIIAA